MEYEIVNSNDELTHWGVKGMRWGIRRYQRKDGSLTPAGEKRLKKERAKLKEEEQVLKNRKSTKAKLDRLAAKRKALDDQKKELDGNTKKSKKGDVEEGKPSKKSVKDMTDDELLSGIRRAQLEQQYSALTAKPEPIAKGNNFVKDFMSKAAVPALQEAGKQLIRDSLLKAGKKYLGLNTENADDYVTKLGKEVKKMTLEKQYKKLKDEFAEETAKVKASEQEKSEKSNSSDTKKTKRDVDSQPYQNKGGEKTQVDPNESRTANTSEGRSASSTAIANLPASVSNISSKTKSMGQSRISGLLEGSTVGPKGSEKLATYDENGNFIGYWSAIRGDSDGII